MAEEIKVGLVIKIIDYDDTSQIVSVLTNDEIISFIAMGTRKLQSKNRIAIQLGNLIEFSFFRARLQNKLSKLKKAVLINQPPIKEHKVAETILKILNWLNKMTFINEEIFNGIIKAFSSFDKNRNEWIETIVLYHLTEAFGIKINNHSCVECNSYQDISDVRFYKGGFLCRKHQIKARKVELLKAVYHLDDIEKYFETELDINRQIQKELISFIRQQEWI